MNLPVKRVENRTGDQKYWSYGVDSDKTRMPSNIVLLQGQVTTIPHIPIWHGQAQNFDPLGRRDSGYICGKILKLSALRD